MTSDSGAMQSTPSGSTPVPDPTALTTAAVDAAREQWRLDLGALREIVEARLDAIDTATRLHQGTAAEVTGRLERQLAHLKELLEEKIAASAEYAAAERRLLENRFGGIALQFLERDVRTEQAAKTSSDALAAALQAAKELVNAQGEASAAAAVKSETSFTKQLDQVAVIISTLEKALDSRITEVKERLDRAEGSLGGRNEAQTDTRLTSTLTVSMIAVLLTVILVGVAIFAALKK